LTVIKDNAAITDIQRPAGSPAVEPAIDPWVLPARVLPSRRGCNPIPGLKDPSMLNRKLGDIVLRQNPVTLPVTATVQQACRAMRDRRVGAILVLEGDGRLVGLFTGRDAVGRVAAEALDPATTILGEVMTLRPDTLRPNARATDALRMMQDAGYRHIPILDGERLAGIVSFGDFTGLERARLDDETGFWEIL
jgi:CBS domain-containing protein